MSLAHARALLGKHTLHVCPHEPDQDLQGLGVLARWAERWSPVVSVDAPDGLLLDISGCEHLFGGERAMALRIAARFASLGITASLAVASTVGAAWGAARFGTSPGPRHVEAGCERAAIQPLPLAALRADAGAIESLHEVGVRTVGELLALPRAALPARYGAGLIRRMDQSLGLLPEPVFRLPAETAFRSLIELPGGTTALESVEAASRDALARLCELLEQRGQGLRHLRAVYDRIDHQQSVLVLRVTRATRNVRHLWSLLRPGLERMQMGEGIERLCMLAGGVTAVQERQETIFAVERGAGDDGAGFAETLDLMIHRLGRDRVLIPVLEQSHRPERSFALRPVVDGLVGARVELPPLHRPSRLIEPPEPVRVVALRPDGPVARLWRGGREITVAHCVGPERIGGEWWRCSESIRDYFRALDDRGVWLWLFRDGRSGEWFVHGEWA